MTAVHMRIDLGHARREPVRQGYYGYDQQPLCSHGYFQRCCGAILKRNRGRRADNVDAARTVGIIRCIFESLAALFEG